MSTPIVLCSTGPRKPCLYNHS